MSTAAINFDKTPKLIVFEGPDGSGKTTQVRKTEEELKKMGFDVVVFTNPCSELPVGKVIREQFLKKDAVIPSDVLGVLYMASFRELAQHIINHHMHRDVILFDRWWFSAVVYNQRYLLGDESTNLFIEQMCHWNLFDGLVPYDEVYADVLSEMFTQPDVLLFEVSPEIREQRISARSPGNYLDRLDGTALMNYYLELKEHLDQTMDYSNIHLIDANKTEREVHIDVAKYLVDVLGAVRS